MYVFVHVPKTAGTSLREALCASGAVKRSEFDYGPDSPKTSALVTSTVYADDLASFRLGVDAEGVDLLAGHFPARKYASLLPDALFIAFVRDPLERCYSEYLHHRRHNGLDSPFLPFLQKRNMINVQSRLLKDLPESSVVGVSELYAESLRLLNAKLGLELAVRRENVHRSRLDASYARRSISAEAATEFRSLNQADIELYEHHREKLEQELRKLG